MNHLLRNETKCKHNETQCFCGMRNKESLQLKRLPLTRYLRRPYWRVKKTAMISDNVFDDGSNIDPSLGHQQSANELTSGKGTLRVTYGRTH